MPKATNARPTCAVKHFEARLERMRSRLNWVIICVPFDAATVWGLRGQIKVKGEINGFAFRTSLFPTREGCHILLINKRMQKGARAVEGSVARFQMELDREERIVTIPHELKRILNQDRSLRRWYDGLNHSTRSDIAKWIGEPKSGEARARRAEQIAERMLAVMEAEQELPPIRVHVPSLPGRSRVFALLDRAGRGKFRGRSYFFLAACLAMIWSLMPL